MFMIRFFRLGKFFDNDYIKSKKGQEKMNDYMMWIELAVCAIALILTFLMPWIINKYIAMSIRLQIAENEGELVRRTASMEFLLAAKMCRCVPGHAFAILPDGRVFGFPGSKVAEASVLGCEKVFFEVLTDRAGRGMADEEISRRMPTGESMWRVKMGDVIVYFEAVYGKGLRNALGVDARDAAAFHVELQSVRAGIAAKAAKSGKEETEVCND